MIAVVGTCAIHKFRVVFHESQGRVHLLIGQGPVTVLIVQVMTTTLQKNTQRLGLRFADQGRVVMSAPNVDEAAHVTQHFLKLVRSFPGDRECADTTTADASNSALLG